jgi:hypothetical protein
LKHVKSIISKYIDVDDFDYEIYDDNQWRENNPKLDDKAISFLSKCSNKKIIDERIIHGFKIIHKKTFITFD